MLSPHQANDTLTVVLPLLSTLLRMLRLWGVVLSGNLVGIFLFALCIGKIVLFDPRTQESLTQIGVAHIGASFWTVLVRAVFAGWLIALMVWLLPGAESARVSIVGLITSLLDRRQCFF
jgi:formate-nitrite transporter family protein